MENAILLIATAVMLVPLLLFVVNRQYFYLSLIVLYPFMGQLIGSEFLLFNFALNPSMLFGFLILFLTAFDVFFHSIKHPALEFAIIIFIFYAVFTCMFSPVRMASLTWVLKIATWLLILVAATRVFSQRFDTKLIFFAVAFGTVTVVISFAFSYLGFYGKGFVYETGVESYGAGFSSGKTLGYYLAIAVPILTLNSDAGKSFSSLISYLLIGVSLAVIILTFVRAPVLALLIGFFVYQYYIFRYGGKSVTKIVLVVTLSALTLAGTFLALGNSRYTSRWVELGERYEEGQIDKLGSGRVGGLMGFYDYYVNRASFLKKLAGSGIGSSYVYLGNKKYIHNDYAEILMGCGIIGFGLYALIMFRLFLLLKRMLHPSHPFWLKRLGALAMSNFFIVLSFHMTNVTTGVIYLSMWAVFTGALIGIAEAYGQAHWAALKQAGGETV